MIESLRPSEEEEMASSRAKCTRPRKRACNCLLDLETGDLGTTSEVEEEDIWLWVEECMRNKEMQPFLSRSLDVGEDNKRQNLNYAGGMKNQERAVKILEVWAYLNAGVEKTVKERRKI